MERIRQLRTMAAVIVVCALGMTACGSVQTLAPPSPTTLQQYETIANGVGLGICAALPAAQRTAAIPIITKLVALTKTDVPALLAQLEAAVPGSDTPGVGQVWQAIHNAFTVIGVAAAYEPVAIGAVDGCATALGIQT